MEKAKQNGEVLTVEKYHTSEITWEDVVKFLYSESLIPNEILKDSIISELTRDDTDLFNTDEEMVVKVFEILSKRATVLV